MAGSAGLVGWCASEMHKAMSGIDPEIISRLRWYDGTFDHVALYVTDHVIILLFL